MAVGSVPYVAMNVKLSVVHVLWEHLVYKNTRSLFMKAVLGEVPNEFESLSIPVTSQLTFNGRRVHVMPCLEKSSVSIVMKNLGKLEMDASGFS